MTYVIAEVGVSHGGYLDRAYQLVIAAKYAGADCVKFQHFSAKDLGQPDLARFELGLVGLYEMKRVAESLDIDFLCTPFGVTELNDLIDMGLDEIKLSHRHQTALWRHVPDSLRVIASAPNIEHAREVAAIVNPAVLLYCATDYPTDPADVDLGIMASFVELAPFVGYSDHTRGIETSIEAVRQGASVIEKHLTLGNGYEDAWSATPEEFASMVRAIRGE